MPGLCPGTSADSQRALHAGCLVAVDRAVELVLAGLEVDGQLGLARGVVVPFFSMPLPSIATACGTLDGLAMVTVTLPALALSDVVSNFSAPPGSAVSLSEAAPPPPPPLRSLVSTRRCPVCRTSWCCCRSCCCRCLRSPRDQERWRRAVDSVANGFPMAGCTQGPAGRFGSVAELPRSRAGPCSPHARVPGDHHHVVVARLAPPR